MSSIGQAFEDISDHFIQIRKLKQLNEQRSKNDCVYAITNFLKKIEDSTSIVQNDIRSEILKNDGISSFKNSSGPIFIFPSDNLRKNLPTEIDDEMNKLFECSNKFSSSDLFTPEFSKLKHIRMYGPYTHNEKPCFTYHFTPYGEKYP